MAQYVLNRSIAVGLCILSLVSTGCVIRSGSWSQAQYERTTSRHQYERTTSRQAPLGANTAIDVESRFGTITITGTEAEEFDVTATITGRAPTEEEAQELAEETEIRLEPVGNTLRVRADTPTPGHNRSVSVSYTITAPRRMNVTCDSDYGRLHVAGIEGTVTGKSGNGSVGVEDIRGPVNLRTSYGSITCRNVTGQMAELKSGNGSITIADFKGSVKAETSYGAITCENFSDGDFYLKSDNGRIALVRGSAGICDASSSYGAIGCNDVKSETIKLNSGNGSVELADVDARTLALSSSYGTIRARQITTANLMARSGNGGLTIVCSASCPADLKAEVESSYGSIDFTAPPEFAGRVHLSTDYGSVRTTRPVTLSGEIDKKNVTGTVGQGAGSIHLETNNGSVALK